MNLSEARALFKEDPEDFEVRYGEDAVRQVLSAQMGWLPSTPRAEPEGKLFPETLKEDKWGDTAVWAAREPWEQARDRFMQAGYGGTIEIPDTSNRLLRAYMEGLDYAASVGLAGLDASDAAWKFSVGLVSEIFPMGPEQEKRFTRDISSLPDAFMGTSPSRLKRTTDDFVDSGLQTLGQAERKFVEYTDAQVEAYKDGFVNSFAGSTPPTYLKKSPRDIFEQVPWYDPDKVNFRNPLVEAIDYLEEPRKGITGGSFLSAMRKNNSVSNPYLDYTLVERYIDPNKRYTKAQLKDIVQNQTVTIEAVEAGYGYSDYQRQLKNNYGEYEPYDGFGPKQDWLNTHPFYELGYVELNVRSSVPRGTDAKFVGDVSHYTDNTLAHTRFSIIRNTDTEKDSILVEELQSDLIQAGDYVQRPGSESITTNTFEELLDAVFTEDFKDVLGRPASSVHSDVIPYMNDLKTAHRLIVHNFETNEAKTQLKDINDFAKKTYKLQREQEDIAESFQDGLLPQDKYLNKIEAIERQKDFLRNRIPFRGENPDNLTEQKRLLRFAYEDVYKATMGIAKIEAGDKVSQESLYFNFGSTPELVKPPVSKNLKDATDMLVKSLISYADKANVDEIIIPNLERILLAGRKNPEKDPEGWKRALEPNSPFFKTYNTALGKTLKELEENYPEVKITQEFNSFYKQGMITKKVYSPEVEKLREELGNLSNLEEYVQDETGQPWEFFDIDGQEYWVKAKDYDRAKELAEKIKNAPFKTESEWVNSSDVKIDISKLREKYQVDKPRY